MTTAIVMIGLATFYAPGVMERVADYRHLTNACPECIGYAAMVEPAMIGQRIWITRAGQRPEGPFLVVDCGQAEHRARQRQRGLVVEVDHQTAQRWRMHGGLTVHVSTRGGMPVGAIP